MRGLWTSYLVALATMSLWKLTLTGIDWQRLNRQSKKGWKKKIDEPHPLMGEGVDALD